MRIYRIWNAIVLDNPVSIFQRDAVYFYFVALHIRLFEGSEVLY